MLALPSTIASRVLKLRLFASPFSILGLSSCTSFVLHRLLLAKPGNHISSCPSSLSSSVYSACSVACRWVGLLTPHHQVTHLQQNVFFDGTQQELSSKNMVLRLRFYNGDERCVVTLKGKAVIIDGISRGSEVEEDIDVALARACVCDSSQLVGSDCKLLQQVIREYKCEKLLCLGGFRNVRNIYNWEGVQLELDETHYEFGTTYEIECETSDPERFRQLLGELLDKNRITYRYSTISKFGIFMAGKIGAFD